MIIIINHHNHVCEQACLRPETAALEEFARQVYSKYVYIGLFCSIIGLFCSIIGLFCPIQACLRPETAALEEFARQALVLVKRPTSTRKETY